MLRSIAPVLVFVLLIHFAAAQQASEPTPVTESKLVLHDGEPVVMRALERVTSSTATIGQVIRFEIIKPVKVGDLVIIPERAIATAKVIDVEKPKRMGRGGKLSISMEHVQMLDGQFAQLRTVVNRRAGGKDEMASDMAATAVLTYGLSLPLTPLFLLKHGNDMAISPGDRFQAFIDGDLPLERNAFVAASSSLATQPEVAVLYFFRSMHDTGNVPQASVLCGEALVGVFHEDQFVRLELPPGLYWCRTGQAAFKKTQRLHEKDYLAIRVEAGSTYFVQVQSFRAGKWSVDWDSRLVRVEPAAGAVAVTEINYRAESSLDKPSTRDLEELQLQPVFKPDPQAH